MSKFNTKAQTGPNATTYEGGAAYEKKLEDEWLNTLFSSLMSNTFYENEETQTSRYINLTKQMLEKYGFDFVAKASIFSRQELGLRSISQLTAAMLNDAQSENKRTYFRKYFRRADDVAEVFGAVDSLGRKRSHALVRGAGDYLSTLGDYQLDKYSMNGKEYNMSDLVNITHAHSDAIDRMKAGTLAKADTWEQRISASTSQEEKEQNWKELVESHKLGYLALLRNLRNICACDFATADWLEKYLIPDLTNELKIRDSLVFPYQIYCAYKNIPQKPMCIMSALDYAFRCSVNNVPGLYGNSLVVLDVSGSMDSRISYKSNMTIKEVCAVYATAIYLSNPNSEFIKFGDYAVKCQYNRNSNVFDVIKDMQKNDGCGYGTDIVPVWKMLDSHYQRIFLFSDMQVMDSGNWWGRGDVNAIRAMNLYFKKYGETNVYSFDVSNYHTQIANPDSHCLKYFTGLTDMCFKFIALLEDGTSIVDYINKNYSYM